MRELLVLHCHSDLTKKEEEPNDLGLEDLAAERVAEAEFERESSPFGGFSMDTRMTGHTRRIEDVSTEEDFEFVRLLLEPPPHWVGEETKTTQYIRR